MSTLKRGKIRPTISKALWDVETDGLLPDLGKIWCLTIVDLETKTQELFTDYDPKYRSLDDAFRLLGGCTMWAGHNLIAFDVQVLKKLRPDVTIPPKIVDTVLLSRLLYPEIGLSKVSRNLPTKMKYKHSLKAWGLRLGEEKGDYDDWSEYTPEMGEYCLQDGVTSYDLLCHLKSRCNQMGVAWDFEDITKCVALEHEFAKYVARQVSTGFYFDKTRAQQLTATLQGRKIELEEELSKTFEPKFKYKELKTKCNIWWEDFNPASRKQVAERLLEMSWKPTQFTKTGQPKVDADVLETVGIPEAKSIVEYLLIDKRLGQVANGANAWLKLERGGRIHGELNTIGAVTGRVTHMKPNMSQVPAVHKQYGEECRSFFGPRPGWKQVGADLSGIELRCLAHYLHRWDNGEYADIILNGDIHTANQEAAGLPTRNNAKTFIYGWLYGAGNQKIGKIVAPHAAATEQKRVGKKLNDKFQSKYPAFKHLTNAVKRKMKLTNGYLRGLDGRPLLCRSDHSALNTLLQSAGAVVAKHWYVSLHRNLNSLGYVYGEDYETMAFMHDEVQLSVRPDLSDVIGKELVKTATETGESLGTRCQVNAEYIVGNNWKDCH